MAGRERWRFGTLYATKPKSRGRRLSIENSEICRGALASLLSGGEQQMLAIARALLSKPKLLLLDEPSLGLAPKLTDYVFGMIAELREEGLTVLLVEQKARQTLKVADRAYLLETGYVVTSGRADELVNDKVVSETFLGGPSRSARQCCRHGMTG